MRAEITKQIFDKLVTASASINEVKEGSTLWNEDFKEYIYLVEGVRVIIRENYLSGYTYYIQDINS